MASAEKNSAKPYKEWVHCNRCYKTFIKKDSPFLLLACRHVNCKSCQVKIQQDINGPEIYICQDCQEVTRAVEVNNTMPSYLKDLFHPEPYVDGLDTSQVLQFQGAQRRRFLQQLNRNANLITDAEKTIETYKETAKKMLRQIQQTKNNGNQAKRRLLSIHLQSRSDRGINSSNSHNMKPPKIASSSGSKSRNGPPTNGQTKDGITSFSSLAPKKTFFF